MHKPKIRKIKLNNNQQDFPVQLGLQLKRWIGGKGAQYRRAIGVRL